MRIDDSAFPATNEIPVNQAPVKGTVRIGTTYFALTAPDGNGNVQTYSSNGEIVQLPGGTLVEVVDATLVIKPPAAPAV